MGLSRRKRVEERQTDRPKSKEFPVLLIFSFVFLSFTAVLFNSYVLRSSGSAAALTRSAAGPRRHRRICRDRSIFISDASSGPAREAAILLSQQGFHVLAGVKTEAQRRSFVYDVADRKGLEPVVTDISDPSQLAALLYRLRQVAADLQRPMYGVLINSVLEVEYLRRGKPSDQMEMKGKSKNAVPHPELLAPDAVDVESVDMAYRRLVKGPMRLLQAASETGMWGPGHVNNSTAIEIEDQGRGRGGSECASMVGRVVLLSPVQKATDSGSAGEIAVADPIAALAMLSALHSLLLPRTPELAGFGSGILAVEVVELWQRTTGSIEWVLDTKRDPDYCSTLSSGDSDDCRTNQVRPVDPAFGRQANAIARAFLSAQPHEALSSH